MGPTQSALKKGRFTTEIIRVHRSNISTVYKTKKNSIITSIDVSAAFDTIQRNLLIETCSKFFPADDITLITYLLSNTILTIKSCNNKSNLFESTIGAPQADSLSPILFCIYLKEAISQLSDQLGEKELIHASNIDFVTEKPLDIIESSKQMAKYNLKVNPEKTEITTLSPTSLDNIKTKKLGTYLSMNKEIYHRKALTLVAMNKLWILCHKNKISQNKKLRMFGAYILPILLYNCGTWSLMKTSEEKLDAFHRRLLRRIIGDFWSEKITNKELYRKTSQIKLSSTIRNKTHLTRTHTKTESRLVCANINGCILPSSNQTNSRPTKNQNSFSFTK